MIVLHELRRITRIKSRIKVCLFADRDEENFDKYYIGDLIRVIANPLNKKVTPNEVTFFYLDD